jgi:hypothetical protein
MTLALCICKASKPEDIVIYFKGLVTKQMCKDNVKQYPKMGYLLLKTMHTKYMIIMSVVLPTQICDE